MSSAPIAVLPRSRVDAIPAELKALDRWCVTQVVPQADGTNKKRILIAGTTGAKARAKSDDPKTWRSFAEAERDARVRGFWLTFVFDQSLPYFFIDIDEVIDAVTGEIAKHATRLIEGLDTYTEYGLSGDGYHVIGKGRWAPNARNTTPPVEMYPNPGARFCIFSGLVAGGRDTIEERQAQLGAFFPERISNSNGNGSTSSAGYAGPAGQMSDGEMRAVVAWAAPYWKPGKRHPLALSLGGYLAKSGVPEGQAVAIIEKIAVDVDDTGNVVTAVRDSYADLRAGGNVSGWSGLRDKIGLPSAHLRSLERIIERYDLRLREDPEKDERPRLLRVRRDPQIRSREVARA
jgi:hypothetical protein